MIEKRFEFVIDNGKDTIYDLSKKGSILENFYEIEEMLNNLNDKNEQLKSEYKVLHTQHQDLRKFVENNFDEHLTQEKLNRQIIKLSDENEKLKQQLQSIIKLTKKIEDCTHDIKLISDFE